MARLTRTWPALAVWGSGLLHLSLGASLTLGMARPLSTAVAVGLLLIGAAELVWGALALRAGRPVAPRTAAVGALVAIGVSGGALASGSSPLAVAAAVLLTLGAVAALARARREARDGTTVGGGRERVADPAGVGTSVSGSAAPGGNTARGRTSAFGGTAPGRPWVATVGAVAGAVIVAALVTPALSSVYIPGADAPAPSSNLGPHAGH